MTTLESVILTGLLKRIKRSPDFETLLKGLRNSCGFQLAPQELPVGADAIVAICDIDINILLEEGVLLTKTKAVEFLRAFGVLTSESVLKKQLFKQRRYQEKFNRDLMMFGSKNIYTYAELFFLIDRPSSWDNFSLHVNRILSKENVSPF
jgi:hypothetical protein